MYTDPCEMAMSMLNAQKVGRANAVSKVSESIPDRNSESFPLKLARQKLQPR